MSDIKFSTEQKEVLVQKLKVYFDKELELDVGQFDCEFFLDFISTEIGSFYYNKGLSDAQAIVLGKVDDITDAFYELERPVNIVNK